MSTLRRYRTAIVALYFALLAAACGDGGGQPNLANPIAADPERRRLLHWHGGLYLQRHRNRQLSDAGHRRSVRLPAHYHWKRRWTHFCDNGDWHHR